MADVVKSIFSVLNNEGNIMGLLRGPTSRYFAAIDGQSRIMESHTQNVIIDGKIDGQSVANIVTTGDVIVVNGKIDGQSRVHLKASQAIFILGKVDGQARVILDAPIAVVREKLDGQVKVWTNADFQHGPIKGQASVERFAQGEHYYWLQKITHGEF